MQCSRSALLAFALALSMALAAAPPPGRDAASTAVFAVELSAAVRAKPAQIVLTWQPMAAPMDVFRRTPGQAGWRKLTTTPIDAKVNTYIDDKVQSGQEYEYSVITTPAKAIGYISSGIELPPMHERGKIILIVESRVAKALPRDLALLQYDLVGDGWQVIRHDVPADNTPAQVKELIANDFAADKTGVRAVYLFGNVPIPYSGNFAPDGHADHMGAWPADGYYGCIGGAWTDQTVRTREETRATQVNIPGDGRFDQNQFPADLQFEVGRVDLSKLTGFPGKTDTDLLSAYIRKSHAYRHAQRTYPPQAAIADNFGHFGQSAFAATGFRSFPPIVGSRNCIEFRGQTLPQFAQAMAQRDWLFAYGCGPGTFTSAGGVIAIDSFRNGKTRAPFWILFGSYFGDWAAPNSLLRAPLAGSDGLSNCWSGFPLWFFHPMGMGRTLGYCARLSMNNGPRTGDYRLNPGLRGVHTALMGDPTLRLFPVAPPTAVNTRNLGQRVAVMWTAPQQKPLGYYVYRADDPAGPFVRLTAEPVTTTAWQDPAPSKSKTVAYMVRAAVLQTTPSGTWHNLSQGAFDNAAERGSEPPR